MSEIGKTISPGRARALEISAARSNPTEVHGADGHPAGLVPQRNWRRSSCSAVAGRKRNDAEGIATVPPSRKVRRKDPVMIEERDPIRNTREARHAQGRRDVRERHRPAAAPIHNKPYPIKHMAGGESK